MSNCSRYSDCLARCGIPNPLSRAPVHVTFHLLELPRLSALTAWATTGPLEFQQMRRMIEADII